MLGHAGLTRRPSQIWRFSGTGAGEPSGTHDERTPVAELTQLEEKLGEVIGLAQAAQDATTKVAGLPEADERLKQLLDQMSQEAAETQQRGEQIAGERDGKKTALQEKARETKAEATEMMKTYLGDDADALDGLEFLIMAEAGELGHWEIVQTMATKAKDRNVVKLAEWATPIQQGHFETVRSSSLALAREEDPNEPEG
jgi:hypothetical protein